MPGRHGAGTSGGASGAVNSPVAHGHVLRVFGARWIGLPSSSGQQFLLDMGTLCVLGYYREIPALKIWNVPLLR